MSCLADERGWGVGGQARMTWGAAMSPMWWGVPSTLPFLHPECSALPQVILGRHPRPQVGAPT